MSKLSLSLITMLLFTTIIFANENKTKVDFSKFEHYATIKTKKALIAKFGKANLIDGVQYYAEGTVVVNSTTLKNPNNGHVVIYDWDDNFKTSSIKANYILKNSKTQKIKAKNGLYLGMSLSALRKWNGANFKFSGFGWDFGGNIHSSQKCRITKSSVSIDLHLLNENGYGFALGDVELNADDKRLKNAKIVVSQLKLYVRK